MNQTSKSVDFITFFEVLFCKNLCHDNFLCHDYETLVFLYILSFLHNYLRKKKRIKNRI